MPWCANAPAPRPPQRPNPAPACGRGASVRPKPPCLPAQRCCTAEPGSPAPASRFCSAMCRPALMSATVGRTLLLGGGRGLLAPTRRPNQPPDQPPPLPPPLLRCSAAAAADATSLLLLAPSAPSSSCSSRCRIAARSRRICSAKREGVQEGGRHVPQACSGNGDIACAAAAAMPAAAATPPAMTAAAAPPAPLVPTRLLLQL